MPHRCVLRPIKLTKYDWSSLLLNSFVLDKRSLSLKRTSAASMCSTCVGKFVCMFLSHMPNLSKRSGRNHTFSRKIVHRFMSVTGWSPELTAWESEPVLKWANMTGKQPRFEFVGLVLTERERVYKPRHDNACSLIRATKKELVRKHLKQVYEQFRSGIRVNDGYIG